MSPSAIFMRAGGIFNKLIDRNLLTLRLNLLSDKKLLKLLSVSSFDELFVHLDSLKHPCLIERFSNEDLNKFSEVEKVRVILNADEVMSGEVSLLGITFDIGAGINWHIDYKSNISWPYVFFTKIDTLDLDRDSDVKIPWELSRLQWIIPVVQAWIITGNEKYAEYVKSILKDWIKNNTYAIGVNWACTMEPSMRIFTWTWIYQVLSKSKAWDDLEFKILFLKTLYLHLLFIRRYIEITDVNGNHLLANSAALVVGGAYFGDCRQSNRWKKTGLSILESEIVKQVYDDGVDFEGSIPYHRFATELFFFPAMYLEVNHQLISNYFKKRVFKMSEYIKSYTKPDGTAPIFGDADDGRVLPFGGQEINDHQYLHNIIGARWYKDKLIYNWDKSGYEVVWWLCDKPDSALNKNPSVAFPFGGSYIIHNDDDYVFIDCGPLGLKNRGGHGHNDCLSFEASLCGVNLICDSGSYTYTSDYKKRNFYRATSSHNTPMIANQEINRFIDEKNIWFLHGDAKPRLIEWSDSNDNILFKGTHTGYERLKHPINPVRTILLDKKTHTLVIYDNFSSLAEYSVEIPLHLAADISVKNICENSILLENENNTFVLDWENKDDWAVVKESYEISQSYGVKEKSTRLCWTSKCGCSKPLTIYICPEKNHLQSYNYRDQLKNKIEGL